MPGGDGTGPDGLGSRTGRSSGFCAGFNSPGFMHSGVGRRNRFVNRFFNRYGYGRIFCTAGLFSGFVFLAYCYFSQKTNKT